ncbi:MAG: glycosyltransferase family 2 protein [Flavobacteriaceae bacterium]
MIKLSVHMMTYNCEKYIDQSLKSVLRQKTTFPFEVIISDDASTDKTYQIITDIAEKYDFIKPYQNKNNLGILKNFLTTLQRCKGEYVFDLAGDDWLSDPYALQTLVDELDQNPSFSFVDSGFDCYYQRSGKIKSFVNKNIVTSAKEEYIVRHKIYGTSFMGCCYRKSSIEKYVNFDEYRKQQIDFEDYPILTDLMMNSDFGLIPKVLSVYRKHRDSHSHKADSYLKVKLYFAEKYNYSKTEVTKIHQVHDEHMLHNASLTSNKKTGRKHYKPLRRPILRNFVYFVSSQSHLARRFFTLFRKI